MTDLRIGSLCSGYGGLDMAVVDVLGGSVAWHCQYDPDDKHQYAARILEHRWPHIPNHGDITQVDWAQVEPVDVLTAGFPCQDISYAGRGAGIRGDIVIPAGEMACGCQWADHDPFTCDAASPSGLVPSRLDANEAAQAAAELNEQDLADPAGPPSERFLKGTRSGLWYSVADAIHALRPRLVVLENVRAIVSRRPGLDVVLTSLAELGFNAEWLCIRASDVGATHERWRWFCLAEPADDESARFEGARVRGWAACDGGAAADADDERKHRRGRFGGQPQRHAAGPDRHVADTDLGGQRADECHVRPGESDADGRPSADSTSVRSGEPADETISDAAGRQARVVPGRGDERTESGCFPPVAREATPDTRGHRRERGEERHSGQEAGLETPCGDDAERRVLDWRQYGPAVARWEHILGRPAPSPVDDRGRLAPRFVEWMMGLPEGHVCDVPAPDGMTAAGLRNARLKALGNGVVRQQAAYALRLLLDRMGQEVAA